MVNIAGKLTVGSLFSGIGGIEIGLERTGRFETVWFSEIAPYPAAILAERWPETPNLGDITKIDWKKVRRPDVLAGGFPCINISSEGDMVGITGRHSGLWKEYLRAIRALRPKYVLVENVAALTERGLNVVLGDLAESRYSGEWFCVPAGIVGAPHRRDRIFILAYTDIERCDDGDDTGERRQVLHDSVRHSEEGDADRGGCVHRIGAVRPIFPEARTDIRARRRRLKQFRGGGWWEIEPELDRVVDELPAGMDESQYRELVTRMGREEAEKIAMWVWRERIRSLGNAVVPAVAEYVGRELLTWIDASRR